MSCQVSSPGSIDHLICSFCIKLFLLKYSPLDSSYDVFLHIESTGAGCSKLTTSLVNVSLKFQTQILQIQDSHIFPSKNNSVFAYVVGIYLTN